MLYEVITWLYPQLLPLKSQDIQEWKLKRVALPEDLLLRYDIDGREVRITSYNVCYTKLLRLGRESR